MDRIKLKRYTCPMGPVLMLVLLLGGTVCAQEPETQPQPQPQPAAAAPTGLDTVVTPFLAENQNIAEVIQLLAMNSGIDIGMTKEVGAIPVTASYNNMSVKQILDTLLPNYGLGYTVDEAGVVTVKLQSQMPPTEEKLIERTFDIKYANFSAVVQVIQNKKSPRGSQYHVFGQNKIIIKDTPGVVEDIEATIRELDVPTLTVQIQLNYINASDAQTQIQPLLTEGPGTIQVDSVRNIIVLRDTPDRIREAQEVLRMLDQPREIRVFEIQYADPEEIVSMIEAMGILSEKAQIQVHLGTNKIIIQDIPARVEQVAKLIASLDEPPLQVLIEAEIVEIRLDNEFNLGMTYEWGKEVSPTKVGGATSSITTGVDLLMRFANGSLEVSDYSDLFGTNFKYVLNMAKTLNLANAVASPFGRVRNHETFDFQDGSEEPYEVRQQQTYANNVTSGDIYTQRYRSVGRILSVQPHANSSGMISLDISVEDSSARDKKGSGNNTLLAVDKKSMLTYVDVMDGHTVAIGGIIEQGGSEGKNGIPFLMDIPLLGRLFRTETKKGVKRKLLIFITPHIEKIQGPGGVEEEVDLGLGEEAELYKEFDWTDENTAPPFTETPIIESATEGTIIKIGPDVPETENVVVPEVKPEGETEALGETIEVPKPGTDATPKPVTEEITEKEDIILPDPTPTPK